MTKKMNRYKLLWSAVLVLAWATVLTILIRSGGHLTLEQLLAYEPEDPLQAVLVMLGLFALKSVDFVMHSGVLYAADGVMFPLAGALALNAVGALILTLPGYYIGLHIGGPVVAYVEDKYPRLRALAEAATGNELLTSLMLRAVGVPTLAASVLLGARRCRLGPYLLGSLLGQTPLLIVYTLIGKTANDVSSPSFWIAAACNAAIMAASLLVSALLLRRKKAEGGACV